MLTLGIETSGRDGQVALCRGAECLDERTLMRSGRRPAQTLVAEIDELFSKHGLKPRGCEAVAVSIGPGSFTGLRIGVVCAKTFAYATGCRLAAVETFASIAANAPPEIAEMFVIEDAQREQLYVGRYRCVAGGDVERDGSFEVVEARPWCAAREAGETVTGPAAEKYEAELAPRCRVLPPVCRYSAASTIARLGQRLIETGQSADPWSLVPLYLRKSAAEDKRDAAMREAEKNTQS